jgi:hypothetical protein
MQAYLREVTEVFILFFFSIDTRKSAGSGTVTLLCEAPVSLLRVLKVLHYFGR